MNKIYKKENNLVIEIPLITKRLNCYDPELDEEMDNIVAMIAGDEIGFAYNIDMSYSGKSDQHTSVFYQYSGKKKEFLKICKNLDIDIVIYPLCGECNNVIYGCYTIGNKGNLCYNCENNLEMQWKKERI